MKTENLESIRADAARCWQQTPRLQKRFPNCRDFIADQIAISKILDCHQKVLSKTPPPNPPLVEVSPAEEQMLLRANELYAQNPNLRSRYGDSEAFGRLCLKTAREGRLK